MSRWVLALPVVVVATLLTALALVAQTADPFVGTWKLNLTRSIPDPGRAPKSQTVKVEPAEGGYKITSDSVDAQGRSDHTETVQTFDGAESSVAGAPQPTTQAYRRIDDRTYEQVTRVNGRVAQTVRVVISPDGKTRTVDATGTNLVGQPVHHVSVFDRQ